jgi:hypothetical protein
MAIELLLLSVFNPDTGPPFASKASLLNRSSLMNMASANFEHGCGEGGTFSEAQIRVFDTIDDVVVADSPLTIPLLCALCSENFAVPFPV